MVTQDFPPSVGGIQTYCRELGLRLAEALEGFAVLAPAGGAAGVPFKVHRVPLVSSRAAMAAATVTAVPAVCRAGRYDVVLHAQWNTAVGGLVARQLGLTKRVVVAAHGRELLLGASRGYRALRRSVLDRADQLIPVSRYTADLLARAGAPRTKIAVVHNGVDADRFFPADGDAWRHRVGLGPGPLLLTASRLVPRKGIDTVLRALPRIAADVPDVVYAVVGTGPDRRRLERIANDEAVTGRVRFLGHVDDADLCACLSAPDVFVMPARSDPPDVEGFGIVFLEAGACGRPVVGAAAGGVPDAIVPGVTGELVPPDDPAALAAVLVYLLRDPEYADRLGEGGRRRATTELTWDHAAERIAALL